MSAYVVVELNVVDSEKLAEYSQKAGPTVTAFGGEFIAKGQPHFLVGESSFTHSAVIRFDTKADAVTWYESDDYQALLPVRDEAMTCVFKVVDGL